MKRGRRTQEPLAKPDVAVLRELFEYQHETGQLIHKVSRGSRAVAGRVATTKGGRGYLTVRVPGHNPIAAHRVAWAIFYGQWPGSLIDHINRSRTDNRIDNLREATYRDNSENRLVASRSSGTGLIGVSLHRASGLYHGRIGVCGKEVSLGYFRSAKDAHSAYLRAKKALHVGFVE